jgi:hypothetical protein
MLPLLLNSAMDSILKARYDQFRELGEFPPEARALVKEGITPFTDMQKLSRWRSNVRALEIVDDTVGFRLVGKIDDVLVDAAGHLVPADYKSSGNAPAEDKQKYYVDQLAAYGLMFQKRGHEVADRAYLLHYYVKDKSDPSISVAFAAHVDRVNIDVPGIEQKLSDMVELLNGDYPGHNPDCDKCSYHDGRNHAVV